jgi:large subunit ribosomal protein L11
MNKKVKVIVKIDLVAGKATGAPPVGPSLGQHGINISMFCKEYNKLTLDKIGTIIPAKITIYEDKSYSFILKSSPTSSLLKSILNIKKGSSKPNSEFIGNITQKQIEEISKLKINDLNTKNMEKAISIIKGTAKNMGLKIIE